MREPLVDMLAGGHRNSLGRTEEVVGIVVDDERRLDELFACLDSPDELVRLRAGDALEKVCRERKEWFVPYADRFLAEIGTIDQPSVQWAYGPGSRSSSSRPDRRAAPSGHLPSARLPRRVRRLDRPQHQRRHPHRVGGRGPGARPVTTPTARTPHRRPPQVGRRSRREVPRRARLITDRKPPSTDTTVRARAHEPAKSRGRRLDTFPRPGIGFAEVRVLQ